MRKITVKHYLDKRLKPKKKRGGDLLLKGEDGRLYPLYVQVIVKRQNTKFKSNLTGAVSTNGTNQGNTGKRLDNPEVKKLLETEKNDIAAIVKLLRPFENDGFHLARFSRIYEKASIDLQNLIADNCRQELCNLIMASRLKDLGEVINWDLDYQAIKKGLERIFNAKTQSASRRRLKAKVHKIDFTMKCYDRYAAKNKISFYRWITNGHQDRFEEFVRKNMVRVKNYHKQAVLPVNDFVRDYFLSLLQTSTDDKWLADNPLKFRKFLRELGLSDKNHV